MMKTKPVTGFGLSSVPLKIGNILEKCVCLLHGLVRKSRDTRSEENTNKFTALYKLKWHNQIATVGQKTLDLNRFNKIQLLPVISYLITVRQFMKDGIRIYLNSLEKVPSIQSWRKLVEILGSRITFFNRRSANEVFNMLLTRFQKKDKWKASELEEESLTVETTCNSVMTDLS